MFLQVFLGESIVGAVGLLRLLLCAVLGFHLVSPGCLSLGVSNQRWGKNKRLCQGIDTASSFSQSLTPNQSLGVNLKNFYSSPNARIWYKKQQLYNHLRFRDKTLGEQNKTKWKLLFICEKKLFSIFQKK